MLDRRSDITLVKFSAPQLSSGPLGGKLMILRRHHRRLFFPFGLISLGLLNVMLIDLVQKELQSYNCSGVEINFLPENYWRTYAPTEIPPAGLWKSFRFTGDNAVNVTILANIENEIRQFLVRHDTSEGIRVEFRPETSYDTFVHTMDMLVRIGAERYTHFDRAIWLPRYFSKKSASITDVIVSNYSRFSSPYVIAGSAVDHDFAYEQPSKSVLPTSIVLLIIAYCILSFYQVYRYHQLMLACRLTSRSS
jgi:hypothetical protein